MAAGGTNLDILGASWGFDDCAVVPELACTEVVVWTEYIWLLDKSLQMGVGGGVSAADIGIQDQKDQIGRMVGAEDRTEQDADRNDRKQNDPPNLFQPHRASKQQRSWVDTKGRRDELNICLRRTHAAGQEGAVRATTCKDKVGRRSALPRTVTH